MPRWFSAVAEGGALFMPDTWDETASHPDRHTEQGAGRERLCATPLRCTIVRMARLPGGFSRRPDPKVMFAVHYEDGRTAYMRVSPEAARHGNMVVMDIAHERQDAGEIPSGTIVSVKQVR